MSERRARMVFAYVVVAMLAVVTGAYVYYAKATKGPSYDSDAAARSLRAELVRRQPGSPPSRVHCRRDSKDLFGCEAAGRGAARNYVVSYLETPRRYRADILGRGVGGTFTFDRAG